MVVDFDIQTLKTSRVDYVKISPAEDLVVVALSSLSLPSLVALVFYGIPTCSIVHDRAAATCKYISALKINLKNEDNPEESTSYSTFPTKVDSIEWSPCSDYLRVTCSDFSKVYIKRSSLSAPSSTSEVDGRLDFFVQDNRAMSMYLMEKGDKALRQLWESQAADSHVA